LRLPASETPPPPEVAPVELDPIEDSSLEQDSASDVELHPVEPPHQGGIVFQFPSAAAISELVEEPKQIQIGPNYQCDVEAVLGTYSFLVTTYLSSNLLLALTKDDTAEDEQAKAGTLVWDPTRLTSAQVDEYVDNMRLRLTQEMPFAYYNFIPDVTLSYDPTKLASLEHVLETLHACNYNVEEANAQLVKENQSQWHPKRPNVGTHRNSICTAITTHLAVNRRSCMDKG